MPRTIRRNALTVLLFIIAIGIAVIALLTISQDNSNAQSKINGNQLQFIIGPGSKESFFTILDESRGKTIYWTCGFIHNFLPNNFGGYTPTIQCNR